MSFLELDRYADHYLWDEERSTNRYAVPLPLANRQLVAAGSQLAKGIPEWEIGRLYGFYTAASPTSHRGPYKQAVDFLVPDGTPILAATGGVVIAFKEDGAQWGDDPDLADELNYIGLQHANGEYSEYCHLAPHSVSADRIRVGDRVKRGQQIGVVGKTGYTDRDHLHFMVYRLLDPAEQLTIFKHKSLAIQFDWAHQLLRRLRHAARR